MNLQINLATRFYVDYRKVNLLIACMFVLALSWCLFGIYTLAANYGEADKISNYISRSAAKSSTGKVPDAEFNRLMANIKVANSILDKRGNDWLLLLDNLELLLPESVSLTGLAPAEKGNQLKLTGIARDFGSIKKFIENLEGSSKFIDVYLTDQTHVKEGTSTRGISFSVTCRTVN